MPYGINLPTSYLNQWKGYPRSPFPSIMAVPPGAKAFGAILGKRRALIITPERAVPEEPPEEPPSVASPPPDTRTSPHTKPKRKRKRPAEG